MYHKSERVLFSVAMAAMVALTGFVCFADISDAEDGDNSGQCGDSLTYTYTSADKKLVIEGSGDMMDAGTKSDIPWKSYREDIITVELPDGLTHIGDGMLSACESLESISIPESVTSIGKYAFAQSGLTSITIPDSVQTLGHGAFSQCSKMKTAVIGIGVTPTEDPTNEDGSEFFMCSNLETVELKDGLKAVDRYMFSTCTKLASVVIPSSVTSIGDGAFYSCNNVETVDLGNGIESIGRSAFKDCEKLASVTIPSTVESIGDGAFKNCKSPMTVFDNTNLGIKAGDYGLDSHAKLVHNGKCTLIFDPNEGTLSGTNTVTDDYRTVITVTQTASRDGYSFSGWNTEKDGSGTSVAKDGTFELSGDTTLYAQWQTDSGGGISMTVLAAIAVMAAVLIGIVCFVFMRKNAA